MENTKPKIIVTLGPATNTEEDLIKIKDKGVDFVRINMSHSSLDDLRYFIKLAKKVDIPFIIDTEGSQVRTGDLEEKNIHYEEGDTIKVYGERIIGNKSKICLTPENILKQLKNGDLLFVDFDTLTLKISDISTIDEGYILARVMTEGNLGNNKAVIISSGTNKQYKLPVLSEKDKQSINIGLEEGIGNLALSFVRRSKDVEEVRKFTNNAMHIISKVEAEESLHDIDKIIESSDAVLMDRGDMSKEVPIEKIPLIQKIILKKAKKRNTPVYIATNLLESMIINKKPTRAEVNDVINTILDGASGLILAAETAIGNNPMECINMINKLIEHSKYVNDIDNMDHNSYLSENSQTSSLIEPHGGKLIERFVKKVPDNIDSLKKIKLSAEQEMDIEQIAIGTFSPIEGFMCKEDFQGVLDNMKLKSGVVWTLPIVLDLSEEDAAKMDIGENVALTNEKNETIAIMQIEDKYGYDKEELVNKLYCTNDSKHPGVKMVEEMKPILIGGKIDLIKRKKAEFKEYELTPRQVRKLFEDRGWIKIVGFHTRNVIHRGHEFIQLDAMKNENCDGLFVHPIIGKKKAGDYNSKFIIKSYEKMMKEIYPKNKVVFSTFSTFSRYAGPREAIFTALCRKNFGCSHFIVGRDHTGVGDYYHPNASHQIFDKFPEIGIKPARYGKVFYSDKLGDHVHEKDKENSESLKPLHISGTEARRIFESRQVPPEWFMRPEVSQIIVESIKNNEEVFVKDITNNVIEKNVEKNNVNNSDESNGKVIWFTGLSGSGKTTIAEELKRKLEKSGKKVEILDGDVVRNTLHKNLGFSREDIKENNRLIAELAKEKVVDKDFVLVPIISPYKEDRAMVKSLVGNHFVELFINASLDECIKRDVKGLYKKALTGEIDNFIGVAESHPYEAPENPELVVDTQNLSVEESVNLLMSQILKEN